MPFESRLADVRFGSGLSPVVAPPESVAQMLSLLTGPDRAAIEYPIEDFESFSLRSIEADKARKAFKDSKDASQTAELRKVYARMRRESRFLHWQGVLATLARRSYAQDGFRERLLAFWNDHFTVRGKSGLFPTGGLAHAETYIRPYLAGRFGDLLYAGVTSPMMLRYLDQRGSVGPGASGQGRMTANRGLNENLAREVLELHTLGVDGPYTQTDVRQLAELLTGLTVDGKNQIRFRPDWAEPGAETVLGRSYGGKKASLEDIRAVLNDLAVHPATARHISWKLAVHFVGDDPQDDLVGAMAETWTATQGDLVAVYRALLEHEAAWTPELRNFKPPIDFVASALRALAVPAAPFSGPPKKIMSAIEATFEQPLRRMGQPWEEPLGPDGWPEEDMFWLTPQGVAARLEWALGAPETLLPELPDPRAFVAQALGPNAPEAVRFAARAAESRREGIALVLLSPAFQRR